MILEDSNSQRKMLANRLKNLGFSVISATYGFQAHDEARLAAEKDVKIPLFLLDFQVPFSAEDIASGLVSGQDELNGGQTARLIKQMVFGDKKPFESSVFVCLTGTPEAVEGYEDVFLQIRGKLTEPNAADFFDDVRNQLFVSEIIEHGKSKAFRKLRKAMNAAAFYKISGSLDTVQNSGH